MKDRLGNHIQQVRGVSYKPSDLSENLSDGYTVLLRANNISEGRINFDSVQFVRNNKISQEQILKTNDILVCSSSGSISLVGKSALYKKSGEHTFGAFCKVVRATGKLHPQFIAFYMCSQAYRKHIEHIANGANINNLRNEHLDEIQLDIPTDDQQKVIISKLEKIQSIITHRRTQLSKLDELIKCRFMEQFGGPGIQSRYPTVTLGSISNMISGGTPSSKHPEYFGGNIPFVSTPCLGPNFIDASAAQNWLTELGVQMSSTHIVPANSLMVGNRVGVGKSSINTCEMCTNQDILSFVDINTDKFDLLFVKKVIEQYGPIFESQKRGATIKGVPSDLVKASQIPQVPIDVQRAFVGFVRQTDKFKFVIQQSLDETQKLFDSFMQEYFDS
jgi:type I restriction enzyme S subunit